MLLYNIGRERGEGSDSTAPFPSLFVPTPWYPREERGGKVRPRGRVLDWVLL